MINRGNIFKLISEIARICLEVSTIKDTGKKLDRITVSLSFQDKDDVEVE